MRDDETLLIDSGDTRKYFIQLPNLVDDLGLSVHAFRLYVHIKRVTGASGGRCWKGTRGLAQSCGMGVATVSRAKDELVEAGLVVIESGDHITRDVIRVVDIWQRNFREYSPEGGVPHRNTRSTQEQGCSTQEQGCSTQEQGCSTQEQGVPHRNTKEEPLKKNLSKKNQEEKPSSSSTHTNRSDDDDEILSQKIAWCLCEIEKGLPEWLGFEHVLDSASAAQVDALTTWLFGWRYFSFGYDQEAARFRQLFGEPFEGVEKPVGKIIEQALKRRNKFPMSGKFMQELAEEIREFGMSGSDILFAEERG